MFPFACPVRKGENGPNRFIWAIGSPLPASARINLSILVVRDAYMSSVMGFVDTLTLAAPGGVVAPSPFAVQTVGLAEDLRIGPSRMPLRVDARIDSVRTPDVVIVPALVIGKEYWVPGRYPEEVAWLRRMYGRGAMVCSACSGSLLLAEAGLLDGQMATSHWVLGQAFRTMFPKVRLRMDRAMVIAGDDKRLVMSGAAAAWHDLAMYLVAKFGGPSMATSVAKFFMLEWHAEGQAPYHVFRENIEHGDASILKAQEWLQNNWHGSVPVESMAQESGLSGRSFKRRFKQATGHSPIEYVQLVRIEYAKQRLEHTQIPVDEICAQVGYEDASFFRRIFKRATGLTPGEYRRKFRLPGYVTAS